LFENGNKCEAKLQGKNHLSYVLSPSSGLHLILPKNLTLPKVKDESIFMILMLPALFWME